MENHKVQYRGGFADRNGYNKVNIQMQYDDLDIRTRNRILSVFNVYFEALNQKSHGSKQIIVLLNGIKLHVYGEAINNYDLRYADSNVLSDIKSTILSDSFSDVFSLLEYICEHIYKFGLQGIYESVNEVFEKEFVGYRFIDKMVVPITDKNEIEEINDTLKINNNGITTHIEKSLSFLSDIENPDYENSVKESIMAVEAMCNYINGSKCTLGEALKKLESNGIIIHKALKEAFNKLYGYTSDADGIRHASGEFNNTTTFAEAKFMLVSSSAFINYLKECTSKYKK